MSIANKTTVALFAAGQRATVTAPIWQYAKGQTLMIDGLDLPDSYRVDFANTREKGESKPQIASGNEVPIPDEYLETGKTVFAWIVLAEGEDDSATEATVVTPVMRRAKPTDIEPEPAQQDVIDQLLAAMRKAVQEAEEAAASIVGTTYTDDGDGNITIALGEGA